MVNLPLPAQVTFSCPACKAVFTLGRDCLNKKTELFCPLCGKPFQVLMGLTGKLRKRVYQAIRSHIEGRVYEQQQMDQDHYFEDSGNLI